MSAINPTNNTTPLVVQKNHPFVLDPLRLPRIQKVWAVCLAIFVGIITLGIASIPVYRKFIAFANNQQIKKLLKLTLLPQLVPAKKLPIQMGIQNNGNFCWLIAAMKLLSISDYFDKFLQIDLSKIVSDTSRHKILKNLQTNLILTINALRISKSNSILPNKLFKNLIKSIDLFLPTLKIKQLQQDPTEFLFSLVGAFEARDSENAVSLCETTTVFRSEQPSLLKTNIKILQPNLKLSIHPDDFDLKDANNKLISVNLDNLISDESETTNALIYQRNLLTNAPDCINISISRITGIFKKNSENIIGEFKKCQRPIQLGPDSTITLTQYKVSEQVDPVTQQYGYSPQYACVYKINAAIEHLGKQATSGHYVAHHQPLDSPYIYTHNDSNVTGEIATKAQRVWKNAMFLNLRLVSKTPIVVE